MRDMSLAGGDCCQSSIHADGTSGAEDSMVETGSLMDTAAGFFKAWTAAGGAQQPANTDKNNNTSLSSSSPPLGSKHAGTRSVTPPPPSSSLPHTLNNAHLVDSPISRFRKEPVVVRETTHKQQPTTSGNTDFPEAKGENNQGFETSVQYHLAMSRSFGSYTSSVDGGGGGGSSIVDPNHIQQAKQAISSVTTNSRLSDEGIHQILLAAMHYQTDKAHTLPSNNADSRVAQRLVEAASSSTSLPPRPEPFTSLPPPPLPPLYSQYSSETRKTGPNDDTDDDDEEEETDLHPLLLSSSSWGAAVAATTTEEEEEEVYDDDEFSIDRFSTESNIGEALSSESKGMSPTSEWHESMGNLYNDSSEEVTETTSSGDGDGSETKEPELPRTDKTVSIAMHTAAAAAAAAAATPLINRADGDPQSSPPSVAGVTDSTLRHLDSPLAAPPSALAARAFRSPEEKKDDGFPSSARSTMEKDILFVKSLSMTESEVGSFDGLPSRLRSNWEKGGERFLERLDGVTTTSPPPQPPPTTTTSISPPLVVESPGTSPFGSYTSLFLPGETQVQERQETTTATRSVFEKLGIACFWGDNDKEALGNDNDLHRPRKFSWKEEAEDTLALLGCAPLIRHPDDIPAAVPSSLVRVTDGPPLPSFAESIKDGDVDYRMPSWVQGLYQRPNPAPYDGSYGLGRSRTVIVHEICRGDWTWCTAWSPTGDRLAVASENHHLAVIETMSSAVWRIRHDRRLTGPAKNHTTHSIRSIAWGKRFIATGGTGDAVSIIFSIEPYPIVDVIKGTGFVGTIDWKPDSNVLAIGSRLGKIMIAKVQSLGNVNQAESEILHTRNYDNWVNKVVFSPGGTHLAVGVATGEVFVYNFWITPDESVEMSDISTFKLEDSVLALAWSPDGKWLYAGGEDFRVSIIDTRYWQIIHRIKQDRWVQSISSSHGGTHVAVGAGNSEVSLLETANGWDSVMGIELKGLVPLSTEWHPKDQAIALTGQNDSILVVETTNARHVRGHHLRSVSPILAIEFSPDGRLVLIGNEGGVVTLFSLSRSSFEVVYEMAVTFNDRLSMNWSRNGVFAVVGSRDALLILGRRPRNDLQPENHRTTAENPMGFGGYSIQKVVKSVGPTNAVSVDRVSRYIAVGGDRTIVYDSTLDFGPVMEWRHGKTIALEWSPDRRFLATMSDQNTLTIYDTSNPRPSNWTLIFSLKCDFPGRALCWSPRNVGGLQYLAYGGQTNHIYIMEIRSAEHTWETVLRIPRQEHVYDLDWSFSGLLAAGSHRGTVAIIDLAYLQLGIPVREKDYKWQRQALTCFTEIRRNRGHNVFQSVRWIPSAPGSDSLLAVGGTDGEVEIIDLTERKNCRGYSRKAKKSSTTTVLETEETVAVAVA